MRTNCPACGAGLPQHHPTCSVAPMLAEAEARGAQKALRAVGPKTAEMAQVVAAHGVLASAGQMLVLRHGYALVKLEDLKYLASFACEHAGGAVPACDDAEDRGACCNSCWTAWWAKKVLEERSEPRRDDHSD